MGEQIVGGFQGTLLIAYLLVFGFGTLCLIVGFGSSFLRSIAEFAHELASGAVQPLWLRLRRVILGGAWLFCVAYAVILLFWWNRANLPEALAYAAGCAFAFFVIKKTQTAAPPKSAGTLALLAVLVAASITAYTWGLNSAILRGWSSNGYFVAARSCNTFDRCIESGPYATAADCQRELVAVNGSETTFTCVELQDVPRAYLPWAK